MSGLAVVVSYKYSASSRYLKIFYSSGAADLYYHVPKFVFENFLRSHDKAAFVYKYLAYDLHFSKVSIA
jgi:hypothetical protein